MLGIQFDFKTMDVSSLYRICKVLGYKLIFNSASRHRAGGEQVMINFPYIFQAISMHYTYKPLYFYSWFHLAMRLIIMVSITTVYINFLLMNLTFLPDSYERQEPPLERLMWYSLEGGLKHLYTNYHFTRIRCLGLIIIMGRSSRIVPKLHVSLHSTMVSVAFFHSDRQTMRTISFDLDQPLPMFIMFFFTVSSFDWGLSLDT